MLDELGALQQRSLENNLPTFVLFTGLHYDKVIKDFETESGRSLKLVSLPMVIADSQDAVANVISSELIKLALFDEKFQNRSHEFETELRRLVLWMCLMVGRHFRALEEGLKRIFAIVISEKTLREYRQSIDNDTSILPSALALSPEFQPEV